MAGIGPQDLQDLAEELLAASVEALDTIPSYAPGLVGAPAHTYVSPGEPAADNCCDSEGQLTVHVTQVAEFTTEPLGLAVGQRASRHIRLNEAGLVVTIFRCVPSPKEGLTYQPPSAAELTASADQLNADAWSLWNHLYNMIDAGTLLSKCSFVFMEILRSLPPSGGCGGWILGIRIRLDGYEEVLP
jgi:hypothetical protein